MTNSQYNKLESLVGRYARYKNLSNETTYIFVVAFVRPAILSKPYVAVYGLSYNIHEDDNQFGISIKRGIINLNWMEVNSLKAVSRGEFERQFYSNCDSQLRFDRFYDRAFSDCDNIYSNNPYNSNEL